jgi:hypothetical protein
MKRALTMLAAVHVAAVQLAAKPDPAGGVANGAGCFANLGMTRLAVERSCYQLDSSSPCLRNDAASRPAYFIGQTVYVSMGGWFMNLTVRQVSSRLPKVPAPSIT